MQINKNVCFTGHRPDRLGGRNETSPRIVAIKSELTRVVRELHAEGFRRFISGMAEGVDTWAAEAVISLREDLQDIRLIGAVPHITQVDRWDLDSRDRWESILRAADQVWVTMGGEKRRDAEDVIAEERRRIRERDLDKNVYPLYMQRNRWMVDRAAVVVAVWDGSASGTGSCVQYARERNRKVIRVDPFGLLDRV